MKEKDGEWLLPSGTWAQSEEAFALVETACGRLVSAQASVLDIADLLGATFDDATPSQFYPPEFSCSPSTGELLGKPPAHATVGWAPPFGNAPMNAGGPSEARGLRRTHHALELRDIKARRAETDPGDNMEPPPPGEYQFFSVPFSSVAASLIAMDPTKGTLFGWLPASHSWQPMDGAGDALLDECHLPHHSWRAEIAKPVDGPANMLFVPTQTGLACITPDVASLSYDVVHVGNAPAIGSPIAFDNRIWVPLQAEGGTIKFICVETDGNLSGEVTLEIAVSAADMGLPVSYGRVAVWVCNAGQFRLQKQNDGGVSASFTPWPNHVNPRFDFGSPYLASDGALWQFCFNAVTDCYVWVRVDRAQLEIADTTTLRLCSGTVNFRVAMKTKAPPWEEPEHTDDTASNEFVIPLLESSVSDAVIGLRLASDTGIAKTFESKERIPYTLCFDSNDSEVRFFSGNAPEPWRIRLFIHSGMLWAYHSRARRIHGWKLA